MRVKRLLLAGLLACLGCSDDDPPDAAYKNCSLEDLPLAGSAEGPVLLSARLECQGTIVNLLATAEDPQGDADLQDVVQRIGVFEETSCTSSPRDLMDDFVGSGVEESFGIVVDQSLDPELFDDICASAEWPIDVEISDASGHTTSGRVLATVVH